MAAKLNSNQDRSSKLGLCSGEKVRPKHYGSGYQPRPAKKESIISIGNNPLPAKHEPITIGVPPAKKGALRKKPTISIGSTPVARPTEPKQPPPALSIGKNISLLLTLEKFGIEPNALSLRKIGGPSE